MRDVPSHVVVIIYMAKIINGVWHMPLVGLLNCFTKCCVDWIYYYLFCTPFRHTPPVRECRYVYIGRGRIIPILICNLFCVNTPISSRVKYAVLQICHKVTQLSSSKNHARLQLGNETIDLLTIQRWADTFWLLKILRFALQLNARSLFIIHASLFSEYSDGVSTQRLVFDSGRFGK